MFQTTNQYIIPVLFTIKHYQAHHYSLLSTSLLTINDHYITIINQILNTIKPYKATIFPWFSHGFPMVSTPLGSPWSLTLGAPASETGAVAALASAPRGACVTAATRGAPNGEAEPPGLPSEYVKIAKGNHHV